MDLIRYKYSFIQFTVTVHTYISLITFFVSRFQHLFCMKEVFWASQLGPTDCGPTVRTGQLGSCG
jgi:hypothetical protein